MWWSVTAWAKRIRDGVLKELAKGYQVFDLGDSEADTLVSSVIRRLRARLLDREPAQRCAVTPGLHFPNIETRDELRGAVESALALRGISTDTILAVDGKSSETTRRHFEAVARKT